MEEEGPSTHGGGEGDTCITHTCILLLDQFDIHKLMDDQVVQMLVSCNYMSTSLQVEQNVSFSLGEENKTLKKLLEEAEVKKKNSKGQGRGIGEKV